MEAGTVLKHPAAGGDEGAPCLVEQGSAAPRFTEAGVEATSLEACCCRGEPATRVAAWNRNDSEPLLAQDGSCPAGGWGLSGG